jgi:Zn finger protein HypA/HybF involved in hydrogenase expression
LVFPRRCSRRQLLDIERTKQICSEITIIFQCRWRTSTIILKCRDCGNTFQKERVADGEVVSCPVCDANYKAVIKDGKVRLEDFVFEEKDLEEL